MSSLRKITPEINFGGGLNTKASKSMIKDNESTDMQNMISDLDGNSKKRLGTTKYNTYPVNQTKPIKLLYRFYKSDGTKVTMAVARQLLWIGNDTTGIMTPQTSEYFGDDDTDLFAATLNDKVIIANGTGAAPYYYDTTIRDLSADNFKYCCQHRNYMFLGHILNNPSRIEFSAFGVPTTYDVNAYIDINKNDGDVITQLGSLNGIFYVYKNNRIYAVTGTVFDPATGDFNVTPIATTFGCVASKTLVNTGSEFIFLARDGIRIFDGSGSQVISSKIDDKINGIAAADVTKCAAGYDAQNRWYWFSYRDTTVSPTGVNNSVLIYDLNSSQWYKAIGLNINSFCLWDGAGDRNELYYADSNHGLIRKLNVAATYSDVPQYKSIAGFESTYETGYSHDGTADSVAGENILKEGYRDVYFEAAGAGTDALTITYTSTIDLTSWNNGGTSLTSDYIHFWFYHTTKANLTSIEVRIDVTDGSFTKYFSYGTSTFTSGDGKWTDINPLKSDFTYSTLPVPTNPWSTVKAIKIIATSSGANRYYVDDIYMYSATNTAINAYRDTKIYDFGNVALVKRFIDLYLYGDGFDTNSVTITCYYQEGDSNKSMTWVNAANTDWLIKSRILREGKNIYFRFANSTLDQSMTLNKMLISYKTKTLR